MKKSYEEILTITENKRKIQIKRNSSYFIVKIGKVCMKNYQKKAKSERCYDLDSLKGYLKQICEFHSIDYRRIENQLSEALQPQSEGIIPTTDEPIVEKGGIRKFLQDILGLRPEYLQNKR